MILMIMAWRGYSYRDDYIAPIPESERGDMIKAYHPRLTSDDEKTRLLAAKAWSKFEYVIVQFY
jgi:proline iminopeptidase